MGSSRRADQTGAMTSLPELRRPTGPVVVAGVCAALARLWNVDPVLVRLGFVVATLITGGFAAAAYLALWALLPREGERTEPVRTLLPVTRSWSATQLVGGVAAASVVLGLVASNAGPGPFLVLGLIALVLRMGRPRSSCAPERPEPLGHTAPTTDFERLALAWRRRVDNVAAGLPPDWEPTPLPLPTALTDTRHEGRRRRGLRTWLWIALALGLAWSALAALQATGRPVGMLAWASTTLAVLAVALIAVSRPTRARHGRPPGLLALALVLALTTGGAMGSSSARASLAAMPVKTVTHTAASLPATSELGPGNREVDLRRVEVAEDRTVRVQLDLGRLSLRLPERGNVVVQSTVDLGSSRVADAHDVGADLTDTWRRLDSPGAPTLTLEVAVGLGELEVTP